MTTFDDYTHESEQRMIAERGMLFSGPLVRAILEGRKTQTRRPAKLDGSGHVKMPGRHRYWHPGDPEAIKACPFGQAGDLLWVRETFQVESSFDLRDECFEGPRNPLGPVVWHDDGGDRWYECPRYRASEPNTLLIVNRDAKDELDAMRWRPSIHMQRWAARIILRITDVRLQRVQEISESDARAEGVTVGNVPVTPANEGRPFRIAFQSTWDKIYAPQGKGWARNPWVWALTFELVK